MKREWWSAPKFFENRNDSLDQICLLSSLSADNNLPLYRSVWGRLFSLLTNLVLKQRPLTEMKTEEREAEIQATEKEDGFEPRYFFPSFFSFLSSLCFLPLLCQDLIHLFLLIFSHSFLFWESLFYSFMTWLSLFLSLLSTVFSRTSVSLALKNFTSFYSKNSFLSLHEKEFQVPSSSPVSFSHQTILIWKHIQTTSGWILILSFLMPDTLSSLSVSFLFDHKIWRGHKYVQQVVWKSGDRLFSLRWHDSTLLHSWLLRLIHGSEMVASVYSYSLAWQVSFQ